MQHCVVCRETVPAGRLPLTCAECGNPLHPSCAARVERGSTWRDRRMVCGDCSGERGHVSEATGA